MATFYIHRKDIPGTLSPLLLEHYAKAFRTLYCSAINKGNPKLRMTIRGKWWTNFRDGLYLDHGGCPIEIVKIGRKYVTIEFKNDEGEKERANVELTLPKGEGFTEIMFMDVFEPQGVMA